MEARKRLSKESGAIPHPTYGWGGASGTVKAVGSTFEEKPFFGNIGTEFSQSVKSRDLYLSSRHCFFALPPNTPLAAVHVDAEALISVTA